MRYQEGYSLTIFDFIAKNEDETIKKFRIQNLLETIMITDRQL